MKIRIFLSPSLKGREREKAECRKKEFKT